MGWAQGCLLGLRLVLIAAPDNICKCMELVLWLGIGGRCQCLPVTLWVGAHGTPQHPQAPQTFERAQKRARCLGRDFYKNI